MRYAGILVIVVVLFVTGLHCGVPEPKSQEFDSIVDKYATSGFSGYVLVCRGEDRLCSRGVGYRNRAEGLPNTFETFYESGSLAKPFTALAVLLLAEDGKLDIHEPLRRYLPEIPEPYANVTTFHVLTHTSGMPRGGAGQGLDIKQAITDHLAQPPLSAPGVQVSYSNSGYAVLGALVDRLSGKSLEVFCRERIFKPAGMKASGFCGESIFPEQLCARGYENAKDEGRLPFVDPYAPIDAFGYEYRGMGGLVTNPADLLSFSKSFLSHKLCSEHVMKLMTTEFREGRSCGWEVFTFEEGIRCIAHGGSVQGYACKLWMFPDEDASIIVLGNTSSMDYRILSDLYRELFKTKIAQFKPNVLTKKPLPKAEEGELQPLLGTWSSDLGLVLSLEVKSSAFQGELVPSARPAAVDSKEAKTAVEILSGLAQGTSKPLRENLPERMKSWPAWPDQVLNEQWSNMSTGSGALKDLSVLGCIKGPAGYAEKDTSWKYVSVRLKFERRESIALLTFNEAGEMEMLVLDLQAFLFSSPTAPIQRIASRQFEVRTPSSETILFELEGNFLKIRSGSLILPWQK